MMNKVIDGVTGDQPDLCQGLILKIYSLELVELQCNINFNS